MINVRPVLTREQAIDTAVRRERGILPFFATRSDAGQFALLSNAPCVVERIRAQFRRITSGGE
jgi:hypothetical protein